jgi:predicted  nucleic acid-binding Zn-ribbon protein
MSQVFRLFRLQQIDHQLDQGRNRLREIEAILNDDTALNQAVQRAKESEAFLEGARKILRRAEESVNTQRIKIEQTDATLYGGKVRNPKELQDLQNESAALKRFLSTLEDRQLEAIIAVEEAEAAHKASSDSLVKLTGDNEAANHQLMDEQAGLVQEIRRLETERVAAISPIPKEDLALYEKLRQQRRGVAVAKINNNTCSACGSAINAALLQAARLPNQFARCDSCGRILYAG